VHHFTTLSGCIFPNKACIDNRNLEKTCETAVSSPCLHSMANFGPLTAEIGLGVWGTPANLDGFVFCLRYCSDVAYRRLTKLCTIFGHLLCWYIIYTFLGARLPILAALLHDISAACISQLCGVIQGMELWNFRRGCHLYSAGCIWHRPTFW